MVMVMQFAINSQNSHRGDIMTVKKWVTIKVKAQFSRYNIPEMVGIYYNPYNESVKSFIDFWVLPEFWHEVYGYKHN